MNDDDQMTFWRALLSPEFWLLLITALGASAALQWWIGLPLCVAGLSISALPKYIELWPKAYKVGAERAWFMTVVLSMFNNLASSCGVYLLGYLVRWLWW